MVELSGNSESLLRNDDPIMDPYKVRPTGS